MQDPTPIKSEALWWLLFTALSAGSLITAAVVGLQRGTAPPVDWAAVGQAASAPATGAPATRTP